jgi:regulator of RNase E activity RraA
MSELLERLARLDTCAVSDALDGLGLPGALVGLRPLWPVGRVVAGRARTLRVGPRKGDGPTAHLGTPLIADRSGVVVIPEDAIDSVLDLAERIRDREAEMVAAVRAIRVAASRR